ncbi:MAG: NAD(P)-dependent oxidoreductase, partial [Armatimonadota bacterium]|nr:NAD(P)-dependent oxidoreductase [Armatimonadota bacterium]
MKAVYYPVMLDVRGRRCVVVGGGALAEGKVVQLLEVGAEVVVVSPEVTDRIRRWAEEGRLR